MQFLLLSLLHPLSSPFSTLSPLPSPPLAVTSSTVQQANIKSIMPPQMVSLRDRHAPSWSHLVVLGSGVAPVLEYSLLSGRQRLANIKHTTVTK